MTDIATTVSLLGYGSGTIGALLIFVEFFQVPNYIDYDPENDSWRINVSPRGVQQFSAAGRIGSLLVAIAFALQFLAILL